VKPTPRRSTATSYSRSLEGRPRKIRGDPGLLEREANALSSDYDELLTQAVDVIFVTKQASSPCCRAADAGVCVGGELVDQMEEIGVVGRLRARSRGRYC
jgi:hypothetical protein